MAEICFDIKMISKESIFDYARWMALFLRFRRLGPWSSDLPGAVASMRNLGRKIVGLLGPTQPTGNDSRGKASKARLSDGRRRPPAARRDRRDKAETILWRRFRSGPVIIVVEVERDLGSVFFDLSYRR